MQKYHDLFTLGYTYQEIAATCGVPLAEVQEAFKPKPRKRGRRPKNLPFGMARCSRCKALKPLDDYHKDPTKKLGIKSACKKCLKS